MGSWDGLYAPAVLDTEYTGGLVAGDDLVRLRLCMVQDSYVVIIVIVEGRWIAAVIEREEVFFAAVAA